MLIHKKILMNCFPGQFEAESSSNSMDSLKEFEKFEKLPEEHLKKITDKIQQKQPSDTMEELHKEFIFYEEEKISTNADRFAEGQKDGLLTEKKFQEKISKEKTI